MEKRLEELASSLEMLSDQQVEGIAGGRLSDNDKRILNTYIRECKRCGYSISRAAEELQERYPKPHQEKYLNEFLEYLNENW